MPKAMTGSIATDSTTLNGTAPAPDYAVNTYARWLSSTDHSATGPAQAANDRRYAMLATLDGIIAAQLAKMAEAAHPGDKAKLLDELVTVREKLATAW